MLHRQLKTVAFFIAALALMAAFALLSTPFEAQESDILPLPSTRDALVGDGTPQSCTEAAFDAALAIGGVIRFNCGPAMHTITLTTTKVFGAGMPNATIDGGNLITLSGGGDLRLFRLYPAANVSLLNLVVADGFDVVDGGAILTQGILNIYGSTFRNNGVGTRSGGGIFITEGGTANVLATSFIGNTATERGGAIYVRENARLNIANSTFANNTGQLGGAIRVYGPNAVANVTNVTFYGNNATTDGSTLGAENGGIFHLRNSILANPIHSGHCVGSVIDEGGNIVTGTGCTGVTPASTGDPLLGALTGNPVYFPLAPGSSAFNRAANCTFLSSGYNPFFANGSPVSRDQRGSERPQDGGCDSGSYEIVLNPTPTPSITATPTGTLQPPPGTFTPAPPTLTPTITPTGIPYIELLTNGGFEAKMQGLPETEGWTLKNNKGDTVKCNKPDEQLARTGECSFRFKGSAQENTKLQQKLTPSNITFYNGDQLIFRSYVKAINPTTAGKIKVVVRYADNTPKGKIQLMLIQTSAYTEYKGTYVVLSPYVQKIKVQVGHESTSGKAYVDDVSLIKTLLISREEPLALP